MIPLERLTWGIVLTNFIYLLGITQGALALAVILRTSSARWSGGIFRLAAVLALSFAPIAAVMLLVILGDKSAIGFSREATHPWNDYSSLFARQILSLLAFYVLALAIKLVFTRNARSVLKITPFFLIAFVANESLVAWDLAMMLNHGFADSIYAPFFIAGSIYGGTALLTLIATAIKRYSDEAQFTLEQIKNMGRLLLAFSLVWAYFWWSQFLTIWYANLPEETGAIYERIFAPFYGSIFYLSMALIWVLPFSALLFKKIRESTKSLFAISACILGGLWLDRYLIVMPSLAEKGAPHALPLLDAVAIAISAAFLSAIGLAISRFFARRKSAIFSTGEEAVGWR